MTKLRDKKTEVNSKFEKSISSFFAVSGIVVNLPRFHRWQKRHLLRSKQRPSRLAALSAGRLSLRRDSPRHGAAEHMALCATDCACYSAHTRDQQTDREDVHHALPEVPGAWSVSITQAMHRHRQ